MNKNLIATFLILVTTLSGVVHYYFFNNKAIFLQKQPQTVNKIQLSWLAWQQKYNKTYGLQEAPLRYQYFAENYNYVEEFNAQNNSYRVGLNKFADMSFQEFASILLKYQYSNDTADLKNYVQLNNPIPESVNWLKKGGVTSIKDQGSCGSCYAFSAVAGLESLHWLNTGKLQSFSEQQVVDCSESFGNNGCTGGQMRQVYKYVKTNGIENLGDYPYKAIKQHCDYNEKLAHKAVVNSFANVPTNSVHDMKQAVAQQPVVVGVSTQKSWQLYESGVYDNAKCGDDIDHGVVVIGYDKTSNGIPYWIIKNSWSTDWGIKGYMRMKIETGKGVCAINTDGSYPTKK